MNQVVLIPKTKKMRDWPKILAAVGDMRRASIWVDHSATKPITMNIHPQHS